MFNRITICGRITKDLELKQTNNERPYVRFVLAVNNSYNNTTDFIPVIAWTKTAENLVNYQKKGSFILVDGPLQVRSVGVDENRRTYFNILANRIVYLETKKTQSAISTPTPDQTKTTHFSPTNTEFQSAFSGSESTVKSNSFNINKSTPPINSNIDEQKNTNESSKNDDGILWDE